MDLSRDAAWALVTAHTESESLRKHMLGVEAAVRGYARLFGEDEEAWLRRARPRLRLREVARRREPSVPGCRDPPGARLSRMGHARNPVARGLQRRATRVAAGAHVV